MDDNSAIATDTRAGKAVVPVEEAAKRYVIPEKYKPFRQFSWGFSIRRTLEQFYAEWSGKPGHVVNYSSAPKYSHGNRRPNHSPIGHPCLRPPELEPKSSRP